MIKFCPRHHAPLGFLLLSAFMFLSLPLRAETLRGPGKLPPGLVAAMLGRMKGEGLDARGCARLGDLRGCFGREGARFRGAGEEVELRAVAWGREGKLQKLRWVSVGREGDREIYRGRGIEAWWRAVPLGYEEGFELLRRPQGRGPVEVELEANRVGRKVGGGLRWEGMRYGKLWVTDARGRRVPAVLREEGKKIWIRIEGRGWKYPLRVDPLVWIEQAASLPTGLADDSGFGSSVALSGNGQVAIVGAPYTSSSTGVAYVYTYDSSTGTWSAPVALSIPSGADDFGSSVALSSDGTVALIGATYTNGGPGAAYIYTYDRSTGAWSSPVTLSPPSGTGGFGFSVALSSDGTVALVGAPLTGSTGEAYAYTYASGTGWSSMPVTLAPPSGSAAGLLGSSVALSSSGTVALVGAPQTSSNTGAAYIYTSSTEAWSSTSGPVTLAAPSGASDFGSSVALSADGEAALVGAPDANSYVGAAYIYTYDSGTGGWSLPVTLSAPSGADGFGSSVTMSSDGTEVLVGAPATDEVYVYTSGSSGTWSSPVTLLGGSGGDDFGASAALSSDGTVALVGAPYTNGDAGVASFYRATDLGLALSAPSAAAPGGQYTEQVILTNDSGYASPNLALNLPIPAGTSYQDSSVTSSTQGSCTTSSSSGVVSSVSCDVGTLAADGGSAGASVTLGVPSSATAGTEITETAQVSHATPSLSAQSTTAVVIAPTISGLSNETVTVGQTVPPESFTIGATGTLTVTASSSNTTLLPDSGIGGYSTCTAAGTCTLTLTPVSGAVGTTTVTVTVENGYGQKASASFSLTVQSSAPVLSGLEDVSTTVGSPAVVEDFTVSGVGPLSVETQTTNAALLPEASIDVSPACGSGSGEVVDRCTLTLSPTAGMTGEASVLVKVTDAEGQTATDLMTLDVEPSSGRTSGGGGGGSVGVGMLLGLLVLVGVRRRKLGGRCG